MTQIAKTEITLTLEYEELEKFNNDYGFPTEPFDEWKKKKILEVELKQ